MTGSRPLVSIGLPVFNGEDFLEPALHALLDQDHDELEIVVSDNGSTDATEAIVRDAASDPRIRYHRSDRNRGAAWNYRRTFELSSGPYFKWAAHDDVCTPTFVRRCVDALDATPEAVLAYPKTSLIGLGGEVVGDFEDGLDLREATPSRRLTHLLAHVGEYHPIFGVIRRDALAATQVMGGYVGADIAVLAELAVRGQFVEVKERLFQRRYHDGTSVRANPDPAQRAAWFQPGARRWAPMPTTRLTTELVRAVGNSPVTGSERVRCLSAVGRGWTVPRWRDMGGEAKLLVRSTTTQVVARAPLAATDSSAPIQRTSPDHE
jgi:hypothetical protein